MQIKNIPDPDLLIRTGNTHRLSNFLLWQSAYSEIHISEKNWPEFGEDDLTSALNDFSSRTRKYGKTQISRFRDGFKLIRYLVKSFYKFNSSK